MGLVTQLLLVVQSVAQQVTLMEAESVAVNVLKYENVDSIRIDTVFTMVENGDTLLYEVFFERGESVLLSGNKLCMPVLGLLFPVNDDERMRSSSFDFDDVQLPNGYKNLIEGYASQIRYCFQNDTVDSLYQNAWVNLQQYNENKDGGEGYVGPLVTTKWGQSSSNDILASFGDGHAYNYYVSQQSILCEGGYCPVGCISVAMAQIMKKWNYPDDVPYDCHQFLWSNMPNKLIKFLNSEYSIERDEVARLIYESAESVDMEYCVDGGCISGIDIENFGKIVIALRNRFGYGDVQERIRQDYLNNWENMLILDLDNGSPVLYSGGGHAFVCDGYKQRQIFGGYKFHFNWGWKGKKDGWFTIDDLTPWPFNFNSNEIAVFQIYPTDCWENIIMQCNRVFAGNVPKHYSVQNRFSNNNYRYIVENGASVHLLAGEEILLTDGFYAEEGSVFTAKAAPCDNSRGKNDDTTDSFEMLDENSREELERNGQILPVPSPASIVVYPNPVISTFNICLGNPHETVKRVEVANLQGGIVYVKDNVTNDKIDVSALPQGMYVVRVTGSVGNVYFGKIVK